MDQYQKLLNDYVNDKSGFTGLVGALSGQTLLENLCNDLFICYEIKGIFAVNQTFQKYNELDEKYRKLISLTYPTGTNWDKLVSILS